MRLVPIGRVAGAFGVRGEVRITPYGEDPMALVRYAVLYAADRRIALTLEGGRPHKGALVARAREVATKEAADALRGVELFAPREVFAPVKDEDEFYLADLIGLQVVHRDGRGLGTVKAVQNFGAGDVIEVKPPAGPTFYLPFTREAVPEVKLAEGVLIADPPPDAG